MGDRFFMFHPDQDPDGRMFDSDEATQAGLEGQGWVDDPGKFGHDPTGQAGPEILAKVKAEYEGRLGGAPAASEDAAQIREQLRREQEERASSDAAKDAENEALRALLAKHGIREEEVRTDVGFEREREMEREQVRDERADVLRERVRGDPARLDGATGAEGSGNPDPDDGDFDLGDSDPAS